jgi:hypothetical protein
MDLSPHMVILESPINTSLYTHFLSFSIKFYRLDGLELEPWLGKEILRTRANWFWGPSSLHLHEY